MRTGEVHDIDLHMMLVIVRQRLVGLAEQEVLVLADGDLRGGAVAVHDFGLQSIISR